MNPHSGHLLTVSASAPILPGYEALPAELEPAARRKLAGRSEAQVSLRSGGKLARWAAKRRKNMRKMQKESRRRNR